MAIPEPVAAAEQAESNHTEREDEPWSIEIPDHPGRTESPGFRRAKEAMHRILAAIAGQAPGGFSLIGAISE